MDLKEFMLWHITEYEPALLLNLADDWPALTKWDLKTDEGQLTLQEAFGGEYLEVLEYWSPTYSYYLSDSINQYAPFEDYIEAMNKHVDFSHKYKTRNGY